MSHYRGQQAHHADGLLPEYSGILMHDAYSSYYHALCNAHLLCELQAIVEADPAQSWASQLMQLLRTAWALVKTAKADALPTLPERNLLDRLIQYKSAYLRFVFDFRVPFRQQSG